MEKLSIRVILKLTSLTIRFIYSELDAYLTQPENSRNLWNGVRKKTDIIMLTKFVIIAFVAVLLSENIVNFRLVPRLFFIAVVVYWVIRVVDSNKKSQSKAAILLYGDSKFLTSPLPVRILFRKH